MTNCRCQGIACETEDREHVEARDPAWLRSNAPSNTSATRRRRLPNFARNLSWSFFETPQKHCNSNDANSMIEQAAGELRAKLMGGGGACPGDQWAADVTNVVKPTQFQSPHEDPCDKRRQSKPKNHHYQRKSPRIDDVCNNTHQSTPKTQHARPPSRPQGVEGPGCGARGRRRGPIGTHSHAIPPRTLHALKCNR